MGRGQKTHNLARVWSLAPLLLASCATWDLGNHHADTELHARLSPVTAAWITAATMREVFPAADPIPQHAGAPAIQLADGRFVVHYARAAPGGYRVSMGGRIAPPRLDSFVCELRGATFGATSPSGGTESAARDLAAILVHPTENGCKLSVRLRGQAETVQLLPLLRMSLTVAEALGETARLLRAHQDRPAAERARRALDLATGDIDATPLLARLRARLRVHLALAELAAGDTAAASGAADLALADDSSCKPARRLKARLDARIAHASELARNLTIVANTPGHTSAWRAARELQIVTQPETAHGLRRRALAWLAQGDARAAHHWVQRASALEPCSVPTLDTLARVQRGLGDARAARDTALLDIAQHGFRPGLILALADDYLAMGRPELALRWLGRHWPGLGGKYRASAQQRVAAASALAGHGMALRVMVSEQARASDVGGLLDLAAVDHPTTKTVELEARVAMPPR